MLEEREIERESEFFARDQPSLCGKERKIFSVKEQNAQFAAFEIHQASERERPKID